MAGAPKGNKNAEKWTDDEINKFIKSVHAYIDEIQNCVTLAEATLECGQYEQILRYFETKKSQHIDFAPIKKSKDILKNRIIKNALNNKYNPTMAIFVLKNDYDMNETQNHNVNMNTENIPPLKWFDNDRDSQEV